jgi:hypothetical protein
MLLGTDVLLPVIPVVRNNSTGKTIAVFSEVRHVAFSEIMGYSILMRNWSHIISIQCTDLQVEKRGNFIIIMCVEGPRVISWSLNVCYSPFLLSITFTRVYSRQ